MQKNKFSSNVIFIMGLPGSGKTFLAEHLSSVLSATHISSDKVRETLHKKGKYQSEDKEDVYREMKNLLSESLQKNENVIVDTTFYLRKLRNEFEEVAKIYSNKVYWIWTTATEKTIKKRVSKKRPDSEADFEIYQLIRDQFEPIKVEHLEIKTDKLSIQKNIKRALEYCKLEYYIFPKKKISILNERILNVIETHISTLLITKQYVYKLKKPLRFSFLDFSTLEKRKYYCEEEFQLNNRLTDGMYLEVLPVTQQGSDFFIGDLAGNIVDYTVKMKRIEASKQMHLLLEKNKITKKNIEQIAQKLVPFHKNATVITTDLEITELKENFNDIHSVQKNIKEKLGNDFEQIIKKAIRFSDNFIENNAALFKERIEREMIRDGHGDLHSGNIFINKKPIIFDCIEFSSKLREIDILNELAFFCIDLDAYQQADLAVYFMEKYQELFSEILNSANDKKLFLYYKLYRANIRAKVLTLKDVQNQDLQKREETLNEVIIYLNLMDKYLSELSNTKYS